MKYKRKYKIQFGGMRGWYDSKSSSGDDKYKIDLYDTKEEAISDAEDLVDFHSCTYRIVSKSTKADWDIYCS